MILPGPVIMQNTATQLKLNVKKRPVSLVMTAISVSYKPPEISSGGFLFIMIGLPGAGKTMQAKLLPPKIPPLILEEALVTTKINSVAGRIDDNTSLMTKRPSRSRIIQFLM